MIFINYKNYESGSGKKAFDLTQKFEEVGNKFSIPIFPVVQSLDVAVIATATSLDVWSQHVDSITYGAHTGWLLPENVKQAGAKGVFLNHSEHKLDFDVLQKTMQRCNEVGLKTLIFAADTDELQKVLELKPDFVSYEPPELVGSSDTSVSREKPEVIKKAADIAQRVGIPLIVGAGVKTKEDVEVAVELGSAGVAVASGIIKAENPKEALRELCEGFKK